MNVSHLAKAAHIGRVYLGIVLPSGPAAEMDETPVDRRHPVPDATAAGTSRDSAASTPNLMITRWVSDRAYSSAADRAYPPSRCPGDDPDQERPGRQPTEEG
ncbi:hypothetical protein HCA44_05095 [Rhodococcus sp. HNM0569]|nr:hypothetical protein [Rhodococcus sp. HNM0569]